jgi:arylsulfatase
MIKQTAIRTLICCCFSAVIFLVGSGSAHSATTERPNIILMMADDLGYAELGAYGQNLIRTPNLDRIAENGMRFTRFYTSAPVCAPARCSLMTGRHGGHAYVRDNFEIGSWESFRGQLPLPEGTPTMASVLKEAGYRTGAFGKWGLGEPGSSGDPMKRGFDRFYGYNCQRHAHNYYPRYLIDDDRKVEIPGNDRGLTGSAYAPKLIADSMLEFIRTSATAGDSPFFVYYPTVIPHLALQVPEQELTPYRDAWEETPYTGNSYLPHPRPRAAYAAMITFMDRQVGRLFELLDDLGIAQNTLFLFTSDNGTTFLKGQVDYEFFESVGLFRGLKGQIYEGGIRVPMIAHWPGRIPAGAVSNHIGAHYDILATVAEAAGISTSNLPVNDGISFLPTLLGRSAEQPEHEFLVWDFAGYGGQIAIRSGKWKLLQRDLKRDQQPSPLELYNLQEDPSESRNRAMDFPEIAEKLYGQLIESRDVPEVERFRFGVY